MSEVYRTELTPLSFLERSAIAYPNKTVIVHGDREITYGEMSSLASQTASALRAYGIEPGDRLAYLCPNTPEMLMAHFADSLLSAVLVAINTRLSPEEILDHSGSNVLVGDTELLGLLEPVVGELQTGHERRIH